MNTNIESHDQVRFCKHCRSENVVRRGVRHNKSGVVQLYLCNSCKKTFSANFGFRYRRHSPEIVSEAVHLSHAGMSTRDIEDLFKIRGIKIDNSAVYSLLYGKSVRLGSGGRSLIILGCTDHENPCRTGSQERTGST